MGHVYLVAVPAALRVPRLLDKYSKRLGHSTKVVHMVLLFILSEVDLIHLSGMTDDSMRQAKSENNWTAGKSGCHWLSLQNAYVLCHMLQLPLRSDIGDRDVKK